MRFAAIQALVCINLDLKTKREPLGSAWDRQAPALQSSRGGGPELGSGSEIGSAGTVPMDRDAPYRKNPGGGGRRVYW